MLSIVLPRPSEKEARILSQVERCIANEITLLLCSHPTSSVDRGKYPRYGQNQRT
jgi:hypothetical protein